MAKNKVKGRIEGVFSTKSLRRILLRLKFSSWCGGSVVSNGGSWRPPVVVGGGEGGVRVWVAFGEEERVKIVFFTLKNVFIICRSHLASSSR